MNRCGRLLAAVALTCTGSVVAAPAANAAIDPAAVIECLKSSVGEIAVTVDPSFQGLPVQLPLVRCATP